MLQHLETANKRYCEHFYLDSAFQQSLDSAFQQSDQIKTPGWND